MGETLEYLESNIEELGGEACGLPERFFEYRPIKTPQKNAKRRKKTTPKTRATSRRKKNRKLRVYPHRTGTNR